MGNPIDFFKGALSQFNILGGGKNPANAANTMFNKAENIERKYYQPYINQGQQAYNMLSPIYQQQSEDPQAYYNKVMEAYTPSQYYNYQKERGLRALQNTAAAGGMAGSQLDAESRTDLTNQLLNEDMQQWLNNVMGYRNTGIEGLEGIAGKGFESTKGLTGDISNIRGTQATLAHQAAREAAQGRSDMFSGIGGLGGAIIGGMTGGPLGAGAGLGIGSTLGKITGGWF